jgi:hypothetical protein
LKINLSNEQKLKVYNEAIRDLENLLLLRLTVLGIDIDSFNEDTFTPRDDSTAENDIYKIILRIKTIQEKISTINQP